MKAVLLALALVLSAGAAKAASCAQPARARAMLAEVARSVNAQRAANHRPALGRNAKLDRAAQDHACWMAGPGQYGHKGKGGSTPKDRVKAAGYRSCLTAENIAWGQASAAQVMADWMASNGHRDNILRKGVREIGVGLSLLDGRPGWVLVFAAPC